jgi:hypothetical protein
MSLLLLFWEGGGTAVAPVVTVRKPFIRRSWFLAAARHWRGR